MWCFQVCLSSKISRYLIFLDSYKTFPINLRVILILNCVRGVLKIIYSVLIFKESQSRLYIYICLLSKISRYLIFLDSYKTFPINLRVILILNCVRGVLKIIYSVLIFKESQSADYIYKYISCDIATN